MQPHLTTVSRVLEYRTPKAQDSSSTIEVLGGFLYSGDHFHGSRGVNSRRFICSGEFSCMKSSIIGAGCGCSASTRARVPGTGTVSAANKRRKEVENSCTLLLDNILPVGYGRERRKNRSPRSWVVVTRYSRLYKGKDSYLRRHLRSTLNGWVSYKWHSTIQIIMKLLVLVGSEISWISQKSYPKHPIPHPPLVIMALYNLTNYVGTWQSLGATARD